MRNSDSPWSLFRKNWDSALPICTCRLLFFKYYIQVRMQSCLIRFDFSCSKKKSKNWSRLWLRFVPPLRVPSLSRHSHGRQPPSSLLAWEFVEGRKESTEGSTSELLSLKIPLPIFPSLSCHANLPRLATGRDSMGVNQLQVWVINLQSSPKLPDNVRMELPQSWMHALSSLPNWSQSRDEQKWSMFVAAVPRVSTSCVMFWKFLQQQGSQRSKFRKLKKLRKRTVEMQSLNERVVNVG